MQYFIIIIYVNTLYKCTDGIYKPPKFKGLTSVRFISILTKLLHKYVHGVINIVSSNKSTHSDPKFEVR